MNIGLVLSGGGIRGVAHLGVLNALNVSGITPDVISGTSAGAIIGALYANQIAPLDALTIIKEINFLKFMRPAFRSTALLNLETAIPIFKNYLPHDSFSGLKIPLMISATNFCEGKLVYFSEGDLIRKILASCCIPGVFNPIKIEENYYVDGGILNNLPIEPLQNHCDIIIGSSCNHLENKSEFENIKQVLERAATLVMNGDLYRKKDLIDILIEPKGLGEIGIFDLKQAELIYWTAYEEAIKKIDKNKEKLGLT
jgi:NTE family protein